MGGKYRGDWIASRSLNQRFPAHSIVPSLSKPSSAHLCTILLSGVVLGANHPRQRSRPRLSPTLGYSSMMAFFDFPPRCSRQVLPLPPFFFMLNHLDFWPPSMGSKYFARLPSPESPGISTFLLCGGPPGSVCAVVLAIPGCPGVRVT